MAKLVTKSALSEAGRRAAGRHTVYICHAGGRGEICGRERSAAGCAGAASCGKNCCGIFRMRAGALSMRTMRAGRPVRNASEFITRGPWRNIWNCFDARSNYVSYIAQRPRVQRSGATRPIHTGGRCAGSERCPRVQFQSTTGTFGHVIPFLRRKDAARLSYDKADAWRRAAPVPMRGRRIARGSMCRSGRSIGAEPSTTKRTIPMYTWSVMRTCAKPARSQRRVVQLPLPPRNGRYSRMNWTQYIRQSQSQDELQGPVQRTS